MAQNIELIDLVNLQNETTAVNAINANNETIETAFQDVLSLSGVTPNQMLSNFDMNSNQILNVGAPTTGSAAARLQDLNAIANAGTLNLQPVPTGGTTGQYLGKNSNSNFDTGWHTLSTLSLANPTGVIGLTANNGVAATAMRSDATSALSQGIIPTWTGNHTWSGTSSIISNSTASYQSSGIGYFDPNPLAQAAFGFTAVRNNGAEVNLVLHQSSSTGSALGAGAFKANLLSDVQANSGSAPVWSQASVVTMNAGFALSGTVFEADLNVNNQNYPGSIASGPSAVNFSATGTHDSNHFYGTAAYAAGATGDNFPLWNFGLYLGETGYTMFNTATIIDKSNAPTSYISSGSHSSSIFQLLNTHFSNGDLGIILGVGSAAANDTTSGYMTLVDPSNTHQAGTITRNDSAGVYHAAFNTSSDERLKSDLGLVTDGLSRVMDIKVHKYIGKDYSNPADYNIGFFAQELYNQFPWAVTPSTSEDYHLHPWSVDYGRITPILVASIQELNNRLTALENK